MFETIPFYMPSSDERSIKKYKRQKKIAFHKKSKKAYVIDPTVRFETSEPDQDQKIQEEKLRTYGTCFADLENRQQAGGVIGIGRCSCRVFWDC